MNKPPLYVQLDTVLDYLEREKHPCDDGRRVSVALRAMAYCEPEDKIFRALNRFWGRYGRWAIVRAVDKLPPDFLVELLGRALPFESEIDHDDYWSFLIRHELNDNRIASLSDCAVIAVSSESVAGEVVGRAIAECISDELEKDDYAGLKIFIEGVFKGITAPGPSDDIDD